MDWFISPSKYVQETSVAGRKTCIMTHLAVLAKQEQQKAQYLSNQETRPDQTSSMQSTLERNIPQDEKLHREEKETIEIQGESKPRPDLLV